MQKAGIFHARAVYVARGSGADSEVFTLAPVIEVVAALASSAREVRYLVLLVAVARKVPLRPSVLRVAVGQYLARKILPRRALFERELVERYVRKAAAHRLTQRARPVLEALVRKAEDEVRADREARRERRGERLVRLCRAVQAAHHFKLRAVEALDADADARHAPFAPREQMLGAQRVRVRLDGHFRLRREVERFFERFYQLVPRKRRQRGRCAAAYVAGAERQFAQFRAAQGELFFQRREVKLEVARSRRRALEGAVIALALAEGHVNVERAARSGARV